MMRTIVLFPTVEEAKCFLLTEPQVPVFVTGRGPAQTAAATIRAVKARKPHLVVMAGTAAACDRTLSIGAVVEVTSQFEWTPTREEGSWYSIAPVTDLPEVPGCSADRGFSFPSEACSAPKRETPSHSDTCTDRAASNPSKPGGQTPQIREAQPKVAQIVSSEGAALMAVCEALGVRCSEIRVLSHYAGETPSPEALRSAAERLAETLNEIFQNNEQEK